MNVKMTDMPSAGAVARERQTGPGPRKLWIDSAKGLCILFIVLCHCIRGLESSGIMPSDTAWQMWDNFFYTFDVPVFFFVSGLFAQRSYEKYGFSRFLKTKIGALAYPYVIWQTLTILLMLAASGAASTAVRPVQLLWFPFWTFMQFWFLYALMLVLGSYALLRWARIPNLAILALSVGMLFLPLTGWVPLDDLCGDMIYFSLGLVLRDRIESLQRLRSPWLLAGALACGCSLAAICRNPVDLESAFRAVPAIVGGAGTILASFALVRWPLWQPVCYLGRRSLEIYVAHTIFAAGIRAVLMKGLHTENLFLHISLGVVASIVGPLLLFSVERIPRRSRLSLFRIGAVAE